MISNRITSILAVATALLACAACQTKYPTYDGPDHIIFSQESYDLGVIDNQEWFEIPVSATRTADSDRVLGVEIVDAQSSAVEGLHYELESNTLCIKAGELTTSVRICGKADNIAVGEPLSLTLRLVIDEELEWDIYGIDAEVHLHKCCPVNMDAFTGYCKITSTWLMQYMNSDARLVRTERDAEDENVIVVKDMFYDGYDVRIRFNTEERLNPSLEYDAQVISSTGEAFGTIYGNNKLMMAPPMGYDSYYGQCERFALQYAMMYVEEVGTVGVYVNIFEWISDDEAERIMREGF